jgi:hypothetical protein
MSTPARRPALTLVILLLGHTGAYGQPHDDTAARRHAPILWPAVDEQMFPTLPHPFAFDGVDNDGDGLRDLADADEVDTSECCADRLVEMLNATKGPERRVIYAEPAWFTDHGPSPKIALLQYWFYYLLDGGFGSHPGDSEHAFVFVETLPGATAPDDVTSYRGVRGVVGAGHTPDTANNILVVGKRQSNVGALPRNLPDHMPILVELGKHASAPDRNFDGRFDVGMDANAFRDNVWGSRDIFNLNIWQFVTPFQEWYSFPRDRRQLMFEEHAPTHWKEEYVNAQQVVSIAPPELPRTQKYRLFPLSDLEALYDALELEDKDASKAAVTKHLNEHRMCFWPVTDQPQSVEISGAIFDLMRKWPTDDRHELIHDKADVKNPAGIFKLHLFPQFALGAIAGFGQDADNPTWGVSLQLAELSAPSWIPVASGQPIFGDSTLELYATKMQSLPGIHEFGANYRYFRGGYGGAYGGLGWRRERIVDEETNTTTHFGVELGYAVAFNLAKLGQGLRRLSLGAQLGARWEPLGEPPTDREYALGAMRRTRLQFRTTLSYGFKRPHHPLRY